MKNHHKALYAITFITIMIFINAIISIPTMSFRNKHGTYYYIMKVDNNGKLKVEIIYHSKLRRGSSWILVPKNFTEWKLEVLKGNITNSKEKDAYLRNGEKFIFYNNFTFNYTCSNEFEMKINYEMNYGSIIVEPKCFFFTPQIGFSSNDNCTVYILFPKTAKLDSNKMEPKPFEIKQYEGFHNVTFILHNNIARIAIEYTTINPPNITVINRGIFSVKTPWRYYDLAERLILAYEKVYQNLTRIFAVNLTNVNVEFYAPTLEDLWIGGYVPFNGTHLGEIKLNLFYVRTALGYWEQIAIHELVHHFVWAAGISPELLWFHEGLAEYISFEVTLKAGWTGAEVRRERIEKIAKTIVGNNYGFIQNWKPGELGKDVIFYYAASYTVIKELGKLYGGLKFYEKFFNRIRGFKNITSTDILVYYLSLTAGEDLVSRFKQWNFDIIDIYSVYSKIDNVKKLLNHQNKMAQPWILIARRLVKEAEERVQKGDFRGALIKASIAEFIASHAITLTMLTLIIILLLIVNRLMSGGEFEEEY